MIKLSIFQWIREAIERLIIIRDDQIPSNLIFSATAIVAIGTDVKANGELSPQSKAICDKVIKILEICKVGIIICTGGYKPEGGIKTEARAMQDYLTRHNLLEVTILTDETSTNTYLNAQKSIVIAKSLGISRVIVVTQHLHARRVKSTFYKTCWKEGIEVFTIKAFSPYGGGSQGRLCCFPVFLIWDTLSFVYFKLRGWA